MKNVSKEWFFGLENSQQVERNLLSLNLSILVYKNHRRSFWKWISPLDLAAILPQASSDWRCNKLQASCFLISKNLAVQVEINGCCFFTNRFLWNFMYFIRIQKFIVLLFNDVQSYTVRIVNKKVKNAKSNIDHNTLN